MQQEQRCAGTFSLYFIIVVDTASFDVSAFYRGCGVGRRNGQCNRRDCNEA